MAGRKRGAQSRKGIPGRFWERVIPEPNSGCWLWTGAANGKGYGQLYANGRSRLAHRIAYEMYRGQVPDGLDLDHLCRTPCCVNPDHLEAVPHVENMRRSPIIGVKSGEQQRNKTHCPNGHPYTEDNIYYRPNGHRDCKTCSQDRSREYQRKKRAQPMSEAEKLSKREYHRLWARKRRAERKAASNA